MCCRLRHNLWLIPAVLIAVWLTGAQAVAAPLRNHPVTLTQPNGAVLRCFVSGDEYFNWIHDAAGFTIIPDSTTGYYTYAVLVDGAPRASQYVVGEVDPAQAGLRPYALPSRDRIPQLSAAFQQPLSPDELRNAPKTGAINNLVVFIRFLGETDFPAGISTYDNAFNLTTGGANSMRNYFLEASYAQLTVGSSFYPTQNQTYTVSFQDSHARGYFQPYNATTNPDGYTGGDNGAMRTDREQTLLAAALNAVASLVPPGLNLDGDSDGYIDNICFVVRGEPTGWSSLLWPHKWQLHTQTVYINSKRAWVYNFQLESSLDVGVLCHEMFHSIGAPDLYHYSGQSLNPVYTWDLMEYDLNPPQHMSAYMKFKYGNWIASIPTISSSGTYTLNPLVSPTGNAYRINSPNSASEYFVVEFRKRTGTFESSLGGEGILVYRINPTLTGNANGPPDEVYVYRPGGTTTANGAPANANFNATVGRTSINDSTNPSSFLTSGAPGGLSLSEISVVGATMSFSVTLGATTPSFITNVSTVTVPESGTATFQVKLDRQPPSTVNAAVSRVSGDTDITVWSGASLTFTPANWDTYQTVTLAAAEDADTIHGTAIVRVSAADIADKNVTAVEGDNDAVLAAIYDSTSKVPMCASAGGGCDSGSLLNGRDTISGGAEPNQPNTLFNGCADGTSGTYHLDESIDRIWVHTVDGSLLAPGKTVRIEATVWAFSSSDQLDLYYTGDASQNPPTWTLVTTLAPTTPGVNVLTADYVLPSGSLQAVRASFRYLGAVSSCSTGEYDDHDDLVFNATGAIVEIQSPAAGERWMPGTSHEISWTASNVGSGGSFQLYYWDGSAWVSIATLPVAARSYTWLVPADSVPNALLWVGWLANGSWVAHDTHRFGITPSRGDFNGDGNSDILWRHATQGDVWLWPMDGATRLSQTYVRTVPDTNWEIRGVGDQTGDGKADILWRHKATGQIYVWPMNGGTPLGETYVGTVSTAYDIVGTGDFDGDGKSDILWRHTTLGDIWIWLMDGATPLSQVYVDRVDPAYVVKGVGDLNADAKADIVWHGAAGDVWVWLMDGTTRLSQTWVATVPDTGYQVQGVADVTGDGKADILWWHTGLGQVWMWTMDGATRVSQTYVDTVPDTNYRIVGTGDHDRDGKADILWHHATRGEVWIWLMDGAVKKSQTYVGTVPDLGYQIVKMK